jgi:hypothetical protein
MEVSGQFHAPADLPRGKSPRCPLDRGLNGSSRRSGYCKVEEDLLPCRESNPSRPTHSMSLYRLGSLGSFKDQCRKYKDITVIIIIIIIICFEKNGLRKIISFSPYKSNTRKFLSILQNLIFVNTDSRNMCGNWCIKNK